MSELGREPNSDPVSFPRLAAGGEAAARAGSLTDWHVHTSLSDGYSSPEEVVHGAAALGLARVAITDHDCVDAHRGGRLTGLEVRSAPEVIVGVEIDCRLEGFGIELLGYAFDPSFSPLVDRLTRLQADRRRRLQFYCEALRNAGEPLDVDHVCAGEAAALLKIHLFRALKEAGRDFPGGYREFSAYLDTLGTAPPVDKPTAAEAAELIQDAGGYVLLAHPLYYAENVGLEKLLRAGRDLGCVGVEFLYPYDFKSTEFTVDHVQAGYERLRELVIALFPQGACLSRGSDVHDLAEWPARLAALEQWERRMKRQAWHEEAE